MLALGIVQTGIVFSTSVGLMMTFNWSVSCSPCVYTIKELRLPLWFNAPIWSLFVVGAVIGIAVLEAMCCTALGMAAVIVARNKLGLVGAVALRFTPIVIFSVVPDYSWSSSDFMVRYAQNTWFSFADGGTGVFILLAESNDINRLSFHRGLRAFGAITAMLVTYMCFALITIWAVTRKSRR